MNDFINAYKLCRKNHWICTAETDNGIDDHKVTETICDLDADRLVCESGKIIGYRVDGEILYFSQYETCVVKSETVTDWVGGWGDIKEYCEYTLVRAVPVRYRLVGKAGDFDIDCAAHLPEWRARVRFVGYDIDLRGEVVAAEYMADHGRGYGFNNGEKAVKVPVNGEFSFLHSFTSTTDGVWEDDSFKVTLRFVKSDADIQI